MNEWDTLNEIEQDDEALDSSDDASGRWARDLHRRFERCEVTATRVQELFAAITDESRSDLRMAVMVGLEELHDAYRFEREWMPPCEFQYVRWLATFLRMFEEADEIQEFSMFVSDGAWLCDCRRCTEFANRVDANTRAFVKAMQSEG